jgi:hypothetical protein
VTCNLFSSIVNGAINWPINGYLYHCGNNSSSDSAGVSEVWNGAGGATQQVATGQNIPFLRQAFTNTHVQVYVFDTIQDFNTYFNVSITPPAGTDAVGLRRNPAKSPVIPGHAVPFFSMLRPSTIPLAYWTSCRPPIMNLDTRWTDTTTIRVERWPQPQ